MNIKYKECTFKKKIVMLQNEAIIWSFQSPVSCVWISVVSMAVSKAGAGLSIIKQKPADTGCGSNSQYRASGPQYFLPHLLLLSGDNQLEEMTHLPGVQKQWAVGCELSAPARRAKDHAVDPYLLLAFCNIWPSLTMSQIPRKPYETPPMQYSESCHLLKLL